ncbi:MAG TPA: hypothetical protein VK540_33580 [Polyangiaceae bacterium]|nr:hypothetical protein [Polyangiaceae bacterium]
MKTKLLWMGGLSVGAASVVLGYVAGRARASGIVATPPMTYRGVLTDITGAPLPGSTKNVQLQFWDQATGGAIQCSVGPIAVTLTAGAFEIALSDACTTAVHATKDLWAEVFVDGGSLNRTKLGAVPYALQADTASNAAGALGAQLAAIEARLARDTSGTPQRICTGSTPIGSTAWQAYTATDVTVRVDTSACNFTTRPLYITSMVGENLLYMTTGGSTPYVVEATAKTQFDIFVPNSTPTNANLNKWHIEWIAIGN